MTDGKVVLVTGASGFVGSSFVQHLSNNGHSVAAASRTPMPTSIANVRSVQIGDIHREADWSAALHGVNDVVHLAGRAHVMRENARSAQDGNYAVNFSGTLKLAQQAAKANVRRFVFVSTAKVFGEKSVPGHPFTPDDTPQPVGPYAQSKLAAEEALEALFETTSTELMIVRPPLVYGPGVKGNFRKLISLALKPVPMPLDQFENRRSMIYIDNLTSFLRACVVKPTSPSHILLPTDAASISTSMLVRLIRESAGVSQRQFSLPTGVQRSLRALSHKVPTLQRLIGDFELDSNTSQSVLGWTPTTLPQEGIRATVQHYMSS